MKRTVRCVLSRWLLQSRRAALNVARHGSAEFDVMRLALLMTFIFLLAGCSKLQAVLSTPPCKTTDAYWTDCVGEKKMSFETYVGGWKNNLYDGSGTIVYHPYLPNGAQVEGLDDGTYVGEFKQGVRHGVGTYRSADGDEYVGAFENGKKKGQGVIKYSSGGKYAGEWADDVYHGVGTYTYADGKVESGRWERSQFLGP